jgi:hypothetical protein
MAYAAPLIDFREPATRTLPVNVRRRLGAVAPSPKTLGDTVCASGNALSCKLPLFLIFFPRCMIGDLGPIDESDLL